MKKKGYDGDDLLKKREKDNRLREIQESQRMKRLKQEIIKKPLPDKLIFGYEFISTYKKHITTVKNLIWNSASMYIFIFPPPCL